MQIFKWSPVNGEDIPPDQVPSVEIVFNYLLGRQISYEHLMRCATTGAPIQLIVRFGSVDVTYCTVISKPHGEAPS